MTYSVLYISSAAPDLNHNDVQDIMEAAAANNDPLQISGFLVFDDGNFLQLLEGEEEQVNMIYDRIKKDLRHRNIIPVLEQHTGIKGFDFYHSGFRICDNPKLVEELKNYVSLIRNIEAPQLRKTINLVDAILHAM
ncbi:MAG TPA: BLUF domain-containing protein [Leeuwenhoekiella sp.]|nr:BLUF domain-containing protein [Leeuwenhoekiella sp.]